MTDGGIRVELSVESPEGCPVAAASAETDEPVTSVSRTTGTGEAVLEEFTAPADTATEDGVATVYESGDDARYRFERDGADPCFCEAVEAAGCPVADVRAERGTLVVTFHADGVAEVRSVVDELEASYDVSIRSLSHDGDAVASETVLVDRGRLTDRQREVLRTARDLGYFEYPKGANAGEVAEALGISVSTFAEHLAAAQTKVYEDLLVPPNEASTERAGGA